MSVEVSDVKELGAIAIEEFKKLIEKNRNGLVDADKFKSARVGLGIYTQRQKEFYMIRTKIPAGVLNKEILLTLALAAEKYSNGTAHLTTRQDVQYYFVKHEDAPAILELLLEGGVMSLGAGGNTIRNVNTCDHHSQPGGEIFNVEPVASAVSNFLLSSDYYKGLPRKLKITFCGRPAGCWGGLTDDIAAIATQSPDGDKLGFKLYAGGGQGAMPRFAQPIDDFVPYDMVHVSMLAAIKVFNRHGLRANRNRARLKFLIERIGIEKFISLYREELALLKDEVSLGVTVSELAIIKTGAVPHGLLVKAPTGDLSAEHLRGLANVLGEYSNAKAAIDKNADIAITGHDPSDDDAMAGEIRSFALKTFPLVKAPLVASCNGASTCNEGITNSKGLAKRLEEIVDDIAGDINLRVSVSGCPNACGHTHTADIGLQGSAKKINGVLVPHYQIYLGGSIIGEKPVYSVPIIKIPAKKVPDAVTRVAQVFHKELANGETISALVERLGSEWFERELVTFTTMDSHATARDSYLDWDSDKEFSLDDVGPGECGGAAIDMIDGYFDQARHDISAAKKETGDAPAILRHTNHANMASAKALLVTYGIDPVSDEETARDFNNKIITRGFVPESYKPALAGFKGDRDSVSIDDAKNSIELAESFLEICLAAYTRMNAQSNVEEEKHKPLKLDRMDLTGVACPFNYIKVKLVLETAPSGVQVEVLLDDGSPIRNVPKSLQNDGHKILSNEPYNGQHLLLVEKG